MAPVDASLRNGNRLSRNNIDTSAHGYRSSLANLYSNHGATHPNTNKTSRAYANAAATKPLVPPTGALPAPASPVT